MAGALELRASCGQAGTYGGRRRTTDVEQALAIKKMKNEMLLALL